MKQLMVIGSERHLEGAVTKLIQQLKLWHLQMLAIWPQLSYVVSITVGIWTEMV